MADLTITVANVVPGTGATQQSGTAGEAITIGQCVYLKAADGKIYKAQADGTAGEAAAVGIATTTAAAAGQPISYQTSGTLAFGAILTKGEIYLVSATAGGIAPEADIVTTGHYVSILGVASSTSNLSVKLNASGITIP